MHCAHFFCEWRSILSGSVRVTATFRVIIEKLSWRYFYSGVCHPRAGHGWHRPIVNSISRPRLNATHAGLLCLDGRHFPFPSLVYVWQFFHTGFCISQILGLTKTVFPYVRMLYRFCFVLGFRRIPCERLSRSVEFILFFRPDILWYEI